MALTTKHRKKIEEYISLKTLAGDQDVSNIEDTVNWILDNMALLNDELALDAILAPLRETERLAEIARLQARLAELENP